MSSYRDPFELPGGAVGGIPTREKAKTEPIRLSRGDGDRQSEFCGVAVFSLWQLRFIRKCSGKYTVCERVTGPPPVRKVSCACA